MTERRHEPYIFIDLAIKKFKKSRDNAFEKELQKFKENISKAFDEYLKAKKNEACPTSSTVFDGPTVQDIIRSNIAKEVIDTNNDQTESASPVTDEATQNRGEVKTETDDTTEVPIVSNNGDTEPVVHLQVKLSPEVVIPQAKRVKKANPKSKAIKPVRFSPRRLRKSPRNHSPLSLLVWPAKTSKWLGWSKRTENC